MHFKYRYTNKFCQKKKAARLTIGQLCFKIHLSGKTIKSACYHHQLVVVVVLAAVVVVLAAEVVVVVEPLQFVAAPPVPEGVSPELVM